MRVILQREVERLGAPGDVVEVADGYARNFLLPRGLAVRATKGAVGHAESLRRAHGERMARARAEAEALAQRLTASPLRVRGRAGEGGRLFGSITAQDLAEEMKRAWDLTVDRRQIHLEEPIRSIGVHEVRVHLHPEVNATLSVEVEAG